MGRLKGQTAYLSGPIDRCPNLGTEWRNWIKPLLKAKYGIESYDPMDKPVLIANEHEHRELRHQWKQSGDFHKLAAFVKELRHVDLRLCDKADLGIFFVDTTIHMCGTYEELAQMNREYKPCLIVCKQGIRGIPDWIFGMVPTSFLFDSFENLFDYLDNIDNPMRQMSNHSAKRFVFFK